MIDSGTDPVLLEELVLGDLIRETGRSLDEVLKMGYYEAHRLWLIFDELRARDLQNKWRIHDAANATEEYRSQISEWLTTMQPRRYPPRKEIPSEVWNKIKDEWDKAGR